MHQVPTLILVSPLELPMRYGCSSRRCHIGIRPLLGGFPKIRLILTTALSTLLLSTASFAGPEDMVSKIDVSIDLPAVTNKAAALRYTNIADDLKDAISAILVDRIADTGMVLTIDISEVELSNSYTETVGSADTRLVGSVNVADAANNANAKGFVLTVDVNQARTMFPADLDYTMISAGSNEYYKA